jgi:lipopolysaccharide transport system ATP-binding protein
METAISLDCVSKRFILQTERPRSFYDHFLSTFRRVTRRYNPDARHEFWALRDVSFDVYPGELLSFIGANGGGKSTTLKLIAGILRPTIGRLIVTGRVSAMLELGTGFHPDLTGRENIYLSGAILGLSKAEVEDNLEAIIEFADIGDFLDVPVRNYSSGMYVRLGFAVATHVHPDILLVDEVLAVGDQAFQKKCIAKIRSVRRTGVTVIFVTHHLELARNMSDRVIWFKEGQIAAMGAPDVVIPEYIAYQDTCLSEPQANQKMQAETSVAYIEAVTVLDGAGKPATSFEAGDALTIRLSYLARERISHPVFGLAIFRDDGLRINGPNTGVAGFEIEAIEGRGYVDYVIPVLPLLRGRYFITAGLFDESGAIAYHYGDNMAQFEVQTTPGADMYGVIHVPARWHHHFDRKDRQCR